MGIVTLPPYPRFLSSIFFFFFFPVPFSFACFDLFPQNSFLPLPCTGGPLFTVTFRMSPSLGIVFPTSTPFVLSIPPSRWRWPFSFISLSLPLTRPLPFYPFDRNFSSSTEYGKLCLKLRFPSDGFIVDQNN